MHIDSIKDGVVIDHITAGNAMTIYHLLGFDKLECSVAIIKNVSSKKMGKKDIIKIDSNIPLNLEALGYIDPGVTIDVIRDSKLVEKRSVDLPEKLQGQMKILAYSTSRDLKEIYFLAIINANMNKPGFEVQPLDPDNPDYISALSTSGEKGLVSAVESAEGIKVDKYVASDTETFALAINSMGGLEYKVEKRIDYKTDDFTLILTEGPQTIKGETLIKYFRYLKTLGDDGLLEQGELICRMIDSYVTTENVEQGDKIYERILSKLESKSDISHLEMSKALQMLKIFCESEKKQPATVITGK